MEKQISCSTAEVGVNKLATNINSNPSSQLSYDATKTGSGTSAICSENILCSLLSNNNSSHFVKSGTANGNSAKNDTNGSVINIEKDNNNTILLRKETNSNIGPLLSSNKFSTVQSSLLNTLPDEKIIESEMENGLKGFSCKSLSDMYTGNSTNNLISSIVINECYRDDGSVRKEKSYLPIENDYNDMLKCSQFIRTEKKEYSNDAVNLDELNLSVSRILNSTKTDKEEKVVENKLSIDELSSKTPIAGDHTYHLPLQSAGNGEVVKVKKENTSDSDKQGYFTEKASSKISSDDECISTAIDSKNLHGSLQNSGNQNISGCTVDDQMRKQNECATSTVKTLSHSGNNSDSISIPSLKDKNPLSTEIGIKTCSDEKNQVTTIKECENEIALAETKPNSVLKSDECSKSIFNETPDILLKETHLKNADVKTEVVALQKNGQLETQIKVSPPDVSGEVENKVVETKRISETQVHQSVDFKTVDVLESVKHKPKNATNEENVIETKNTINIKNLKKALVIKAPSFEEFSPVAETSYDCNECGARLKTQNSLFTHKKMHLSGMTVTATANKRKSEENESPKETKRKRGRPKSTKTENSNDITPLKENVAKKALKTRAQLDEVIKPKSKQSAKAVKENKISTNFKTPKSVRSLRLRKNTAKVEFVRSKGRTKGYYTSGDPNNIPRKFICPDCGAKFKRNDHLKRHQLLHSEKTFQCCDCEMKFYRGDKLKLHTLRHHVKVPTVPTTVDANVDVKIPKLPRRSVECHKCGIQFLRIVPPKTDKAGQSRRKNSCCISCGAKLNDENN